MSDECKYDEIGYWSEVKLDIINKYASAYSRILSSQTRPSLYHCYIDAFSGPGFHISKESGAQIDGSPTIAMAIDPPFKQYYFIDLDASKIQSLERLSHGRPNVSLFNGDCNTILLTKVLPNVKYEDYRRGLCLLDPYGLHLDWRVIHEVGKMRSVDIFLNFPICDMNRNVLWKHNPQEVDAAQIERMNRFWGDESWRSIAYQETRQMSLFGDSKTEKVTNEIIAEAFRERLVKVSGFKCVPKPIAMRNRNNATVYYLFFASHKPVAMNIVDDIFDKYRNRRG